ncbi:MAG: GNAT family N-acetyltransferase [Saprospiraceae bacterium]
MITYSCLSFSELSLQQLYALMALRQQVFVVEQDCPYLDADGKDQLSHHLLGYDEDGDLVAYTRMVPPGISYEKYASIGRVVNAEKIRGKGVGKLLMQTTIHCVRRLYPNAPIKISAQSYLLKFYTELGFDAVGEEYLEDNIPHTAMILEQ